MIRASALVLVLALAGTPAQAAWGQNNTPSAAPTDESMSEEAPVSDSAPALPSADVINQFYDVCTGVASGDAGAIDRAVADGWARYEDDATTPYKAIFSASKPFAGFEQVELWSSVETYPSRRLGYCRVDLSDVDGHINFNDFASLAGMTGTVKIDGDEAYGAWEQSDHKIMVIADRLGSELEIEFNLLLPAAASN